MAFGRDFAPWARVACVCNRWGDVRPAKSLLWAVVSRAGRYRSHRKFVAGAGENGEAMELTVAPALLSLVLRQLNERRLARGPDAKITPDLLDPEQEKYWRIFTCRR